MRKILLEIRDPKKATNIPSYIHGVDSFIFNDYYVFNDEALIKGVLNQSEFKDLTYNTFTNTIMLTEYLVERNRNDLLIIALKKKIKLQEALILYILEYTEEEIDELYEIVNDKYKRITNLNSTEHLSVSEMFLYVIRLRCFGFTYDYINKARGMLSHHMGAIFKYCTTTNSIGKLQEATDMLYPDILIKFILQIDEIDYLDKFIQLPYRSNDVATAFLLLYKERFDENHELKYKIFEEILTHDIVHSRRDIYTLILQLVKFHNETNYNLRTSEVLDILSFFDNMNV